MACGSNVACSLFLCGPWAKNDFYIFKGLQNKQKKKIQEEHVSETICDPQSLKIYYMAHYGKSLLTTGLVRLNLGN